MAKFQITLIAILLACVAFVSCDRVQNVILDDATTQEPMDETMDEPMDETMDDTGDDMGNGNGNGGTQ
ncbi:hypothetical protein F4009_17635 [Candidatus Poribacteria bacterium]|nr:hypothetical protein [Candidatus Poribacteria bacterium]MYH80835.1 hypothetical protein [Candidatus Poribacteria bacterium]MYK95789.1 hypothetical protein [Candidatus Poribacteria bacterium]